MCEQRLDHSEISRCARSKSGELSRFGEHRVTRDRYTQVAPSELARTRCNVGRRRRRHRAGIDEDRVLFEMREHPIRRATHGKQHPIIRQRTEHDVGGAAHLQNGGGRLGAPCGERRERRLIDIKSHHRMAGFQQMCRHGAAELAAADPADLHWLHARAMVKS